MQFAPNNGFWFRNSSKCSNLQILQVYLGQITHVNHYSSPFSANTNYNRQNVSLLISVLTSPRMNSVKQNFPNILTLTKFLMFCNLLALNDSMLDAKILMIGRFQTLVIFRFHGQ